MRRLLCVLALTALGTTSACTSTGEQEAEEQVFTPVAAPSVGLPHAAELPAPLPVGVVVSSAAPRGEGAEHVGPAAGARVAEVRLDDGDDARVELVVADDLGTSEGAVAAVQQLLDAGVAGIVYASSGPHLEAGLRLAEAADTAVLLPYESRGAVTDADAGLVSTFRTGPSEAQVASRIRSVLRSRGASTPYLLAGEGAGRDLAALAAPSLRTTVVAGDGLPGAAGAAADALEAQTADAVVVAASAETSAELVAALQARTATTPVVLAPSALAPAFAATLERLGAEGLATTAGQFTTVGPDATDVSGTDGVAAFLSAVRLAAQDASVLALQGTASFASAGAATADVRSHDAVVALARAAAEAGSVAPAEVLGALRRLEVTAVDGLAGPDLAFAGPQALGDAGVVVLQATSRTPAPRTGVLETAPALSWFPLPTATG